MLLGFLQGMFAEEEEQPIRGAVQSRRGSGVEAAGKMGRASVKPAWNDSLPIRRVYCRYSGSLMNCADLMSHPLGVGWLWSRAWGGAKGNLRRSLVGSPASGSEWIFVQIEGRGEGEGRNLGAALPSKTNCDAAASPSPSLPMASSLWDAKAARGSEDVYSFFSLH